MFKSFAITLLAAGCAATGTSRPNGYQPLTITEDGAQKHVYITGCQSTQGGRGISCSHNNGGKIATTSYLDPEGWYRPNVLNGSVSYDIDLSRQQCGCNGAFY